MPYNPVPVSPSAPGQHFIEMNRFRTLPATIYIIAQRSRALVQPPGESNSLAPRQSAPEQQAAQRQSALNQPAPRPVKRCYIPSAGEPSAASLMPLRALADLCEKENHLESPEQPQQRVDSPVQTSKRARASEPDSALNPLPRAPAAPIEAPRLAQGAQIHMAPRPAFKPATLKVVSSSEAVGGQLDPAQKAAWQPAAVIGEPAGAIQVKVEPVPSSALNPATITAAGPAVFASGGPAFLAPRPAFKSEPEPAAADPRPPMFCTHVVMASFHSNLSVVPVEHMIKDLILSLHMAPFPIQFFHTVLAANRAFSRRDLTPQESAGWQKARDEWLSKALGSCTSHEEMENKLQALVDIEAQLPPQAGECFRIKQLDLRGYIPSCEFLETLSQLRSLENLFLGRLLWAKDAAALSTLPSLQHLTIQHCDIKTGWHQFPQLPALKSLYLGECSTLEGKHLHYLPGQIETLEFHNPGCLNGQSLPELCRHFAHLNHLKIESASIGPSADLTPLRQLAQLRSLALKTKKHSSFGLKSEQLLKLFQPGAFPHLETIELGRLVESVPPGSFSRMLPAARMIYLQDIENWVNRWVPGVHEPDSTESEAG